MLIIKHFFYKEVFRKRNLKIFIYPIAGNITKSESKWYETIN